MRLSELRVATGEALAPPTPPAPLHMVPSPPRPPVTSKVPRIHTSPVARRSSTPCPLVVMVTPGGTWMVVKW
jgi:hypothetical protein